MVKQKEAHQMEAKLRSTGWKQDKYFKWTHPGRPSLAMNLQTAYYTQLRIEESNKGTVYKNT